MTVAVSSKATPSFSKLALRQDLFSASIFFPVASSWLRNVGDETDALSMGGDKSTPGVDVSTNVADVTDVIDVEDRRFAPVSWTFGGVGFNRNIMDSGASHRCHKKPHRSSRFTDVGGWGCFCRRPTRSL